MSLLRKAYGMMMMRKTDPRRPLQPGEVRRGSRRVSRKGARAQEATAASTSARTPRCISKIKLTMQYQVQEMLRIERIFEAEGINEELEAYNPLIPDGSNWKATFMVEFPEVEERRAMLTQLGASRTRSSCRSPISTAFRDRRRGPRARRRDQDLGRALHALRAARRAGRRAEGGASLIAGIDHENYRVEVARSPTTSANRWSPTSTR